jgi:phospholipase C
MSQSSGDDGRFNPSRRKLLAGIAGGSAAAALAACGDSTAPAQNPSNASLPAPADSGIDHVVVVMMENRSFDHYYGWVPGADGKQAGRNFVDTAGNTQPSHHLSDFQNCASADPDHSYEGGRKELNGGAMDGFLLPSTPGDTFPIGYYEEADLPFHGPAARNWTIFDRYFCSILAETYPNRFYMHSGQTSKLHNSDAPNTTALPTVWDALKAKGVSGNYYYSDIPFTAEYGTTYLGISLPFTSFLLQAAAGTLPAVSYIDPTFLGEGQGVSHDDHPLADIRNGQAFLNQVYNAVTGSPQWSKTLLIINYDEWGGFADHVEPGFAPITAAEAALGNDGRLGFRVPVVAIGPRARRGHVEHTQFDHTSILNLLVWRFGLTPWYPRASTSNNFALALDFDNAPDTTAPVFNVPTGPFGQVCGLPALLPSGSSLSQVDAVSRSRAAHILEMQMLRAKAQRFGFPVY